MQAVAYFFTEFVIAGNLYFVTCICIYIEFEDHFKLKDNLPFDLHLRLNLVTNNNQNSRQIEL